MNEREREKETRGRRKRRGKLRSRKRKDRKRRNEEKNQDDKFQKIEERRECGEKELEVEGEREVGARRGRKEETFKSNIKSVSKNS